MVAADPVQHNSLYPHIRGSAAPYFSEGWIGPWREEMLPCFADTKISVTTKRRGHRGDPCLAVLGSHLAVMPNGVGINSRMAAQVAAAKGTMGMGIGSVRIAGGK